MVTLQDDHIFIGMKNVFSIVRVLPEDGQMIWPKHVGITFIYELVQ
jgi:hypothetical protein